MVDEEFQVVRRLYEQADMTGKRAIMKLVDIVGYGSDAEWDAVTKAMKIPDRVQARKVLLQIVTEHEFVNPDLRRIWNT